MKKFRTGLIAFGVIVIIGQAVLLDYKDMSWSQNTGSYLGIISMLLLIASMILSINQDNRKQKNS